MASSAVGWAARAKFIATRAAAGAALVSLLLLSPGKTSPVPLAPVKVRPFDGSISVMTYNVKGLPWPVASGRTAAMTNISLRLRTLRERRQAPDIIVLQEAFSPDSQDLGKSAGYLYAAEGPTAEAIDSARPAPPHGIFLAHSRWWKGESEGKLVGSGLRILSDYPIVAIHRMAFPAYACAGYDCLANKGALLVTLDVPGAASPIDVVTTHLNSRRAARVDEDRSLYAYRLQLAALDRFIARWHDTARPLIVSGDFNVGTADPRRAASLAARQHWCGSCRIRDALRQLQKVGAPLDRDAAYALRRARDWQFYTSGGQGGLRPLSVTTPFGHEPDGTMLSDHVGYVVRFQIDSFAGSAAAQAARGATSDSRRKG
jgi:endonuclease/exonuclease/phosphatase family metal-dependent hydrolase